jgi:hypothetical protein
MASPRASGNRSASWAVAPIVVGLRRFLGYQDINVNDAKGSIFRKEDLTDSH